MCCLCSEFTPRRVPHLLLIDGDVVVDALLYHRQVLVEVPVLATFHISDYENSDAPAAKKALQAPSCAAPRLFL